MAGPEAVLVLGAISSIITIIDETKKVYQAAADARGLPDAFREVEGRLPIIQNILETTREIIRANNDSCKGVKHIVDACEEKAKKMKDLFHKAIPADGASDLKRYYKAVKVWGRGSEVENLIKGMLEDVQLLACERGMKTATKAQQEEIIKAITEVSAVSPSVPEHELQETGFTNTNYGTGTQYNARGENIAQGSARRYISGGAPMTFGGPNKDIKQACLSALFLTDPRVDREKLKTAKGRRVDGTCQWIESHARYDSWLHSHSQLLWLSGGPGKGKTMLSIFLAEELERIASLSQNKLFLQYFCDNKDEKRNTAVAVIRGLMYQLLQSRPRLFDHILPDFRIQEKSLFQDTSFVTLWRIFEKMIRDTAIDPMFGVLDGLDECDEASVKMLLGKFTALLSAKTDELSTCRLKMLIVSRDVPDSIPESLSIFPRISLDTDGDPEINKDIELFIKDKVKELSERKNYPEELREQVESVFRDRAEGTFLWIGIVAQELEGYKATEVVEKLNGFPPGVDEVYARILLQIECSRREIAARILRWVVMAARPLTIPELSIALETPVETSPVAFTCDEVIRDQVSYCGHILVIRGDEVGLTHQSAKDYLLRKTRDSNSELEFFRVKEEVTNLEIAKKCLDYLQSGALENSERNLLSNTSHLKHFPLLSYAVLHWHEHASSLAQSEDIFDLSRPFYHDNSPIRTSWLRVYWESEIRGPRPESLTLLMLASYFGILPLAKKLVEKLVLTKSWMKRRLGLSSLNKTDGWGRTALIWAAAGGHEAVVQLLLEKGAGIKAEENYGATALIVAARSGHEAVVQLLLEKGADIEAENKYGATALIEAAASGHEAVVRLLLENGAEIEPARPGWETTLRRAAVLGSEAGIRLLLETGADINAKSSNGSTVLMGVIWCVSDCQVSVVQLLLNKGADANAKSSRGETALMNAVRCESDYQESMVRLLLKKGADINDKNWKGETALMIAAGSIHLYDMAFIRLLLEGGADKRAVDRNGETALAKAVAIGHKDVVPLLTID